MAKTSGKNVYARVSEDNSTWYQCGGETDCTLTRSMATSDVTDKDSDNYHEGIAGIRNWGLAVNGQFDVADDSITVIEDAYEANSTIYCDCYDATNSERYTGTCLVTDFSLSSPNGEVVTFTCTLEGTASLSHL